MIVPTVEFTETRRLQIIALLEILDEHLPEPTRRDESTPGFLNEVRARSCPDCLANGRVMFGCETCGGSGQVSSGSPLIAAPDELDTDGRRLDPYAETDWLAQPYGVGQTAKLGHVPERDTAIDRLADQLREPFSSLADEIAEANRTGYVWERERKAKRRRFDLVPLERALDELRMTDSGLAALLLSVYGRRLDGVPNLIEPSATLEAGIDRALRFVNDRMPDPIRAPGDEKHPALRRRDRRAA